MKTVLELLKSYDFKYIINSVSTHPLFYLEFVEITSLAKYVTISTWRVRCELAKTQGDWEENNISVQTNWRKSVEMNIRWTRSNAVVTKHGLSYQPKSQPLPWPEMHDRDSLSTKLAVNMERFKDGLLFWIAVWKGNIPVFYTTNMYTGAFYRGSTRRICN